MGVPLAFKKKKKTPIVFKASSNEPHLVCGCIHVLLSFTKAVIMTTFYYVVSNVTVIISKQDL